MQTCHHQPRRAPHSVYPNPNPAGPQYLSAISNSRDLRPATAAPSPSSYYSGQGQHGEPDSPSSAPVREVDLGGLSASLFTPSVSSQEVALSRESSRSGRAVAQVGAGSSGCAWWAVR